MTWNATTADGIWKTVFGKLEDTIPEYAIAQKRYEHSSKYSLGKQAEFNIRVRRSHGVTFSSGDASLDAFTLNSPVTGQLKPAQVKGSTLIMRERLGYKATLAALEEGPKAFAPLYGEAVTDVWRGMHFYLEALMFYGQVGWGIFAEAGTSTTSTTLKLTAASSAPGLWAQMEGALVDVWDPTFTTKRNSNADIVIAAIDFAISGASAYQVSLSITGNATDIDAIAVSDVVVPKGFYDGSLGHQTMAGFDKICTNATSLFGIDAATYKVWAGSSLALGNTELNFAKLTKAQVLIAVRCGLSESPLDVWIPPSAWADLNADVAATRRSAGNEKGRVEFGAREIAFYGVTGEMVLRPHPVVKCGDTFVGMEDYIVRSGVSKPTFDHPAKEGNSRFLRELADNAGFEFRGLWDQFVLNTKPRSWVKVSEIQSSAA